MPRPLLLQVIAWQKRIPSPPGAADVGEGHVRSTPTFHSSVPSTHPLPLQRRTSCGRPGSTGKATSPTWHHRGPETQRMRTHGEDAEAELPPRSSRSCTSRCACRRAVSRVCQRYMRRIAHDTPDTSPPMHRPNKDVVTYWKCVPACGRRRVCVPPNAARVRTLASGYPRPPDRS